MAIGNIQTNDANIPDMCPEARGKPGAMGFFHHENNLGPFDEFRGARDVGVMAETRGHDFEVRAPGKHMLRGRTPQLIAAAQKQNLFHGKCRSAMRFISA